MPLRSSPEARPARAALRALLPTPRRGAARLGALLAAAALASACATLEEAVPVVVPAALGKHTVHAVTAGHELITFKANAPQRVLQRVALQGLAPGETLRGIDYRVARGVLYALGSSGRLYTVDTASGKLTRVGAEPFGQPIAQGVVGFDVNPAADRIRIVGEGGWNWRAHPDTGALVDADPQAPGWQADGVLRYAPGDASAGRAPQLGAAAYTYNKHDSKLTTNYAIDLATGQLVMQGSAEGQAPVVSPNTGLLRTVGPLGVAGVTDVAFDIADIDNTALAALHTQRRERTGLYLVDLKTGHASPLGLIDGGAAIRGLAIEP